MAASGFSAIYPPAHAVDGLINTYWTAGDYAPQWIEVDLRATYDVGRFRLWVSQSPAGNTFHRLWVAGPDGLTYQLLQEFSGRTIDGQVLEFTPPSPQPNVRYVFVETLSSPSWVGWREIEVESACRDIPGATGTTLALGQADAGAKIRVVVTASNAGGSNAAVSAQTAPVAPPVPPSNTVAPTITGIPRDGETLTGAPGSWTGSQPISFSSQWQKCDTSGTGCSDISGATATQFVVTALEVGSTLRFVVTATGPGGTVAASSAPTAVVAARPRPVLRCVVPKLRGKTLAAGRRALSRSHCRLGRVRRARSRVRRGRIVSQSRRPGTRLPAGARVNVVVSRGRR